MTLQEFINKHKGKKLDWDGKYGNQCVDLYRFYLRDVYNKPQTPGVVGAYQIFNTLPKDYDKFTNGIPKPGDVIIWNEKQVKNGHVAVVVDADASGFRAFQQNAPKPLDPANIARYSYKNIVGWFRPKQTLSTTFMKITVVANRNNWTTLSQKLAQLNDFFKLHSGGRLEVVGDIRKTELFPIPLAPFAGLQAVDVNWYRANITPLATGQLTLFLINPEDYNNGSTWGFMTYGDPGKPVRCEISPGENTQSPEGVSIFVLQAFHEICHALFFLTGQTDKVHELIYQNPPNYKGILDLIDYNLLQQKLVTIKGDNMSQAKVVKSKNSNTVYICYPVPSMTHLNERASLEGIVLPNPIPTSDAL